MEVWKLLGAPGLNFDRRPTGLKDRCPSLFSVFGFWFVLFWYHAFMFLQLDRRSGAPEPIHRHCSVRARTRDPTELPELLNVSTLFFRPRSWSNPIFNYVHSVSRGPRGAFQRFERGEISLFQFYEEFGRDLSDTVNGNIWYRQYCQRRGITSELRLGFSVFGRDYVQNARNCLRHHSRSTGGRYVGFFGS